MKVMTLADIHLHGGADTEEAVALIEAAKIANEEDVDAVIVAGDIFEAKSTPEQRLVFKRFLNAVNCPAVVLRGNHDEKDDLLIFHDPDNDVYVFEDPGEISIFSRSDENILRLHAIPHFNAGAVALQESTLADVGETGTSLFDTILDDIFQAVRRYDGPSMVAFHGVISGAKLDNGMIPRENGIHLNLTRLIALGCPVVGGHYHTCQNVAADQGGDIWYTGSITRQTFGEAKGDKGVLIFECDALGKWLDPRFISLDPTPMVLVDAEWCAGGFICAHGKAQVFPLVDPSMVAGARVRFRYTVQQADLPTVDLSAVKAFFADAGVKELKIEQIVETATAARCSAIAEAQSLAEIIRVWAEAKGEEPERIEAALKVLTDIMGERTQPEAPVVSPQLVEVA